MIYLVVGDSYNPKPPAFKSFGAFFIVFDSGLIEVLGAIEFNDKFRFCTIEIDNVVSYYTLFVKMERVVPKKIVP